MILYSSFSDGFCAFNANEFYMAYFFARCLDFFLMM